MVCLFMEGTTLTFLETYSNAKKRTLLRSTSKTLASLPPSLPSEPAKNLPNGHFNQLFPLDPSNQSLLIGM
jgi:hypothetical protein